MKYYFTWNSSTIIEENVLAWKNKFISKFGDFNCIDIKNIDEIDNNYLVELLTATSFLSEKKLVIIKINWTKNEEDKLNYIISIFENIPENNIVLIHELKPDKRSKIYKFLKSKTTHSEFNIDNEYEVKNQILSKYKDKISNEAIDTIIKYKSSDLQKIYNELNKLLINSDYINKEDIISNIVPELEESIFQIIDSLMNLEKIILLQKIDILLQQTNIYAFYNNFLSNIRTNLYILKHKNLKINSQNITNKLKIWNRWFLVTKNYKITFNQLKEFYIWLVNLDKKMKTWKLFQADDNGFRLELEKLVLKI